MLGKKELIQILTSHEKMFKKSLTQAYFDFSEIVEFGFGQYNIMDHVWIIETISREYCKF